MPPAFFYIMKFMKKFILSALLPLLYFLYALMPALSLSAAKAETASPTPPTVGGYACIRTENVYFYETENDGRGLFLLPKTYYVKILAAGETYCKIEYLYDDSNVKKLVGYAKTEELTFVDYVPRRPYLYKLFEVRYTIEDASAGEGFLNQITVTCAYYGDYQVGSQTYCYVLRGDAFGYIPKPSDFVFEENTEYEEHLPTEAPSAENDPPSESNNPAQIGILVALCLLVPILAALILKPPRRPTYLDND